MADQKHIKTITASGDELADKVKRLIHEGNVRRIVIKREDETILEFPVTVGVIGVVLAPALAAVGVLAALLAESTIEVERTEAA
jgi:repressor of nif and glnA expression